MNRKAFHQFSYGLFLVSAVDASGKRMGCVINTAEQVTSDPYRVLLTLNKDNATCGAVMSSGRLAITVLNRNATMDLVGTFGFKTSSEVDKFTGFDVRDIAGLPWVADAAAAVLACTVESVVDAGTHKVFVAVVDDAEVCPCDAAPLTYDYYRTVLKGTTPPKASSFIADEKPAAAPASLVAAEAPAAAQTACESGDAAAPALHHFRCLLCGHVVETTDEELPADFVCPMCGAGASMFKKVD